MNTPRRQAREAALQIAYLAEMGDVPVQDAVDVFFDEHMPEATDPTRQFAATLAFGVSDDRAELDRLIEQHSQHWRIERLAVVDRLILRLAIWELQHERDTPRAVVLNEALELARQFSGDEAVRFVNGVLDAVRKTLEA